MAEKTFWGDVPEDVIEDLMEASRRRTPRRTGRRRRRPTRRELMSVGASVIESKPWIKPSEFVDEVLSELEKRGFDAAAINERRVWMTYEEMVRKGFLRDVLGVLR